MHVLLWIFQNFCHKQFGVVVFGHSVKYSYCDIFGQLYFWKSYFFTVFESNFFQSITRVTFSEQLFLQSRCLFWGAPFSKQSLFSSFFPPEYLLVQSETSTQETNLENRKFFSVVTFQNSYPQKTSTEELFFQSRFFCTTSTFSKKSKILKKDTFWEKQNSALPTFSRELSF